MPSVERRSRETRETRAARKSWILDSNRNRDSRFLEPRISDLTSKNFRIPESGLPKRRRLFKLTGMKSE